jgi:hypothetical protein
VGITSLLVNMIQGGKLILWGFWLWCTASMPPLSDQSSRSEPSLSAAPAAIALLAPAHHHTALRTQQKNTKRDNREDGLGARQVKIGPLDCIKE